MLNLKSSKMKKKLSFGVVLILLIAMSSSYAQDPQMDSMKDPRDNQVYKTVKIDGQWWMAENLNFDAGDGSWCYDNKTDACDYFGRLYTWETAKNACPSGWHLPTDKEWKDLEKALGMSGSDLDQMGWREFQKNLLYGDAKTGLMIVNAGYRPFGDGAFDDGGDDAYFWTSSEKGQGNAWKRFLDDNRMEIGRGYDYKGQGFSVRCIKD
jgi:uncharacterized protein (TIGR02145 family)